jgi:hypothetical protein
MSVIPALVRRPVGVPFVRGQFPIRKYRAPMDLTGFGYTWNIQRYHADPYSYGPPCDSFAACKLHRSRFPRWAGKRRAYVKP